GRRSLHPLCLHDALPIFRPPCRNRALAAGPGVRTNSPAPPRPAQQARAIGQIARPMVSLYAVSNVIDLLQAEAKRDKVPTLTPGDTVKVHSRVVEGNRERVQIFEGIVIG